MNTNFHGKREIFSFLGILFCCIAKICKENYGKGVLCLYFQFVVTHVTFTHENWYQEKINEFTFINKVTDSRTEHFNTDIQILLYTFIISVNGFFPVK